MTEQTNVVPKRRFKEFQNTHAWEQRELGDLMEISSASRVHKDEWTESGVPFFRSSDVVAEFKGTKNSKAFIPQSLFEKLSIRSGRVKQGDVLVTGGGSIGIPYLVKNDNPLYFKDADLIWLKKSETINGAFLYTFFTTSLFKNYVNSITHIGTISHYTIEQAKATPIRIPTKEEQTKIGNFFKQLDSTIALHQRKLEKTKALKSAYLSEMFPAEGERKPKRRFAGFTDVWKQRKLGEMSDSFEYGLNASATFFDGINKYIRITDIDDDSRLFNQNALTSPDVDLSNADSYLVKNGDILFARTGASVGKTYRYQESDGKVYYAGFLIRARINQDFNSEFVFQNTLTPRYDNFIKITSQRSGQPGVNAQEYASFDLMVPTLEEQQKIGTFFKALDDTITLHQRKLEKLQNIKKAYLHEMFV